MDKTKCPHKGSCKKQYARDGKLYCPNHSPADNKVML